MAERDSKGRFVKGIEPWNKGKKGVMPTAWNKGKTMEDYPHCGFQKGHEFYGDKKSCGKHFLDENEHPWNMGLKKGDHPSIDKMGYQKGHKLNVGRKHSQETIDKLSGENHYNYKGVTPLNKLLRRKSFWKIWREAVFIRDNFTCQNQDCAFCDNKIGVMLHPHHIKPLAEYPELVFNVNNGITYCAEYHINGGLHIGIQGNLRMAVK